jgi:Ni,Fe-hydrogenase III large subunit
MTTRASKHPDFADREMVRCEETTKSANLILGEYHNDVLLLNAAILNAAALLHLIVPRAGW